MHNSVCLWIPFLPNLSHLPYGYQRFSRSHLLGVAPMAGDRGSIQRQEEPETGLLKVTGRAGMNQSQGCWGLVIGWLVREEERVLWGEEPGGTWERALQGTWWSHAWRKELCPTGVTLPRQTYALAPELHTPYQLLITLSTQMTFYLVNIGPTLVPCS